MALVLLLPPPLFLLRLQSASCTMHPSQPNFTREVGKRKLTNLAWARRKSRPLLFFWCSPFSCQWAAKVARPGRLTYLEIKQEVKQGVTRGKAGTNRGIDREGYEELALRSKRIEKGGVGENQRNESVIDERQFRNPYRIHQHSRHKRGRWRDMRGDMRGKVLKLLRDATVRLGCFFTSAFLYPSPHYSPVRTG